MSIEVCEAEYRVVLPYMSYYDILVSGGTVIAAPPIASWSIGKTFNEFTKWIELKGGIIEKL